MLYAPAATPKDVVSMLNTQLKRIVSDPALEQRFANIGFDPTAISSDQAAAVMRAIEAWGGGLGAHTIGLQAVTTNMPAQGLYAALGYAPAGTYHYRFLDSTVGK